MREGMKEVRFLVKCFFHVDAFLVRKSCLEEIEREREKGRKRENLLSEKERNSCQVRDRGKKLRVRKMHFDLFFPLVTTIVVSYA